MIFHQWKEWSIGTLQWCHNGCNGISNHQPYDCLSRCLLKKTSKPCVTGLCAGNSPVTGTKASDVKKFFHFMTSSWYHGWRCPGPWFNINMASYLFKIFHCGNKMVVRSSYLHSEISYTGNKSPLYWTVPLVLVVTRSSPVKVFIREWLLLVFLQEYFLNWYSFCEWYWKI